DFGDELFGFGQIFGFGNVDRTAFFVGLGGGNGFHKKIAEINHDDTVEGENAVEGLDGLTFGHGGGVAEGDGLRWERVGTENGAARHVLVNVEDLFQGSAFEIDGAGFDIGRFGAGSRRRGDRTGGAYVRCRELRHL